MVLLPSYQLFFSEYFFVRKPETMTNMGLGVLVESYQGTAALSGSESVTAPLEVISSRVCIPFSLPFCRLRYTFASSLQISSPFDLLVLELVVQTHGFAFPPFPPYPFVHTGDTRSKEGCENQQLLDAYDIPTGIYNNSAEYSIESDASSATYPLAIAAIIEVLEVIGYNKVVQTPTETTMQGPPIGQLKGLEEVDMTEMTDAFLTATVLATAMIDELVSSGEEMCFEKTWWDDLQNKICSALHFARRRPGTIPRTRIPSEAEPEPYENFAHQHEDVRVRVVDGVQFGELAEFCDLEFNDIPTLLDRKKRLQMALAAASAVEGSLDHLLESALETPAAAGPSNNQSQVHDGPLVSDSYMDIDFEAGTSNAQPPHTEGMDAGPTQIPVELPILTRSGRPRRNYQRPRRYQDNLPEPTSTSIPSALLLDIGPQPEIGPLRRVMLIVRDRLITTANSFGIWRDYPRRPTRDPDASLSLDDLAINSPQIPTPVSALSETPNSSRPAYWPFANATVHHIMQWLNNGILAKSEAQTNEFVHNVILSSDFAQEHLAGFDAHRENQRLDSALL
ncbi:hypothetical protein BJ912DRAFT_1068983 [Pholiota molesta]|nr:hypothetical protein BJ912DRAFT_1068983 [Pholiota molesta]